MRKEIMAEKEQKFALDRFNFLKSLKKAAKKDIDDDDIPLKIKILSFFGFNQKYKTKCTEQGFIFNDVVLVPRHFHHPSDYNVHDDGTVIRKSDQKSVKDVTFQFQLKVNGKVHAKWHLCNHFNKPQ